MRDAERDVAGNADWRSPRLNRVFHERRGVDEDDNQHDIKDALDMHRMRLMDLLKELV